MFNVENLFGVKSKNLKVNSPLLSTIYTKVFSIIAINNVSNNEQHNYKRAPKTREIREEKNQTSTIVQEKTFGDIGVQIIILNFPIKY